MKRSEEDMMDPCIEIDGQARRVSDMSDETINAVRDAIECADGEEGARLDRIEATITDADPEATLTDSRAYVEAFALCHDVVYGRWFAMPTSIPPLSEVEEERIATVTALECAGVKPAIVEIIASGIHRRRSSQVMNAIKAAMVQR